MNKIQVFGMQRSGTNFIEWSLKNNIEGLEYDGSVSAIGNVKGDMFYGKEQSLKHCKPELDERRVALIVKRNFDDWDKSVRNRFKQCGYTKETYDWYYDTPEREDWFTPFYINLSYEDTVVNYEKFLNHIAHRLRWFFNDDSYKVKENWVQPTKRTTNDGGKTLTNIDFNLNVKIT
jgi:hypothetical protein